MEDDMVIDYLHQRIEDLLEIYQKKYHELHSENNADNDEDFSVKRSLPSDDPAEEKKRLDQIIREYSSLVSTTKHLFNSDDEASKKYSIEKSKFENQFAQINCQIQEIRSNNDSLQDEIKAREERLMLLNNEILEKSSLVRLLEERIYEIKSQNAH